MATQLWHDTMPKASLPGEGEWMSDMRALPTLPSVLFRFLGLVGNSSVSQAELADYIWKDPALLARVLPLAEADAVRRGSSGSIQTQIAALSHARIRNIAFTTPLLRSFEPLGTGSYAITVWERSLLCATASEAAAGYLQLEHPDRFYVGGMLHDIGYLVLLQQRPSLLPTILQKWATAPARLLEIEEQMMGVDHCRLGLDAAAQLDLPSWVMPAIGAHHSPTSDSDIMVRITAIGGAFANYQGADFFPRRTLSRVTREREMQEILRVLLPELSDEQRAELRSAMETAAQPVRKGIRETIIDWQIAGESRLRPYFARTPMRVAPLAATA
jgi:HD-like signal output (HDOD) protein